MTDKEKDAALFMLMGAIRASRRQLAYFLGQAAADGYTNDELHDICELLLDAENMVMSEKKKINGELKYDALGILGCQFFNLSEKLLNAPRPWTESNGSPRP